MARVPKNLTRGKKRIGVNIRIYETRASGIQNFIQGLFVELIKSYPQYTFVFFSTGNKKIEKTAKYITGNSIFISLLKKIHPLLVNIFFDNLYILKLIYPQKLDIFIAPSYVLPPIKFKNTKYITVIHDLSYLTYKHNPFKLYLNYVMYMKFIMPRVLKKADIVVVPSAYVKNEVINKYGTNPQKIIVIYEGKDEFFYPIKDRYNFEKIRKKYNLTKKYFFANATNHERKNIFGLITAFSNIKSLENTQLVITGLLPDQTIVEVKHHINNLNLSEQVKYLGYVTKEDLRILYSYAKVFVFPSFEEGFGLPILEAASCGCLPICSNTGSLPEIIGNKRLVFNPRDINSITHKMNYVLNLSKSEYNKELFLVRKHIEKFTWGKTAQEFSSLFKNV